MVDHHIGTHQSLAKKLIMANIPSSHVEVLKKGYEPSIHQWTVSCNSSWLWLANEPLYHQSTIQQLLSIVNNQEPWICLRLSPKPVFRHQSRTGAELDIDIQNEPDGHAGIGLELTAQIDAN